jgi:hypothetical protein
VGRSGKSSPATWNSGLGWCGWCCGCGWLWWCRCGSSVFRLLGRRSLLYGRGLGLLGLFGSRDSSSGSFFGLYGLSRLWDRGAVHSGWRRRSFTRRLHLSCLFELVVDLYQILFALSDFLTLIESCVFGHCSGRGWLLDTSSWSSWFVLKLLLLFGLLGEVAEDVVQDKVAIGLSGQNEGLTKPLVGKTLVGDLTNDLDNDVCV